MAGDHIINLITEGDAKHEVNIFHENLDLALRKLEVYDGFV